MNIFIPLHKVDEERRLIFARAVQEIPDKSGEVLDYASAKPAFEKWSNQIHQLSGGLSKGNVRSMHNPKSSAGKVVSWEARDDEKAIDIVAKIVDDQEWKKVVEGVYTGISVGGSYGPKWVNEKTGLRHYTPVISELSLVDNPCIPTARIIELHKADGSTGEIHLQGRARSFAECLAEELGELGKAAPSFADCLEDLAKADGEPPKKRGTIGSSIVTGAKYGAGAGGLLAGVHGAAMGAKLAGPRRRLLGAALGGTVGGITGTLRGAIGGAQWGVLYGAGRAGYRHVQRRKAAAAEAPMQKMELTPAQHQQRVNAARARWANHTDAKVSVSVPIHNKLTGELMHSFDLGEFANPDEAELAMHRLNSSIEHMRVGWHDPKKFEDDIKKLRGINTAVGATAGGLAGGALASALASSGNHVRHAPAALAVGAVGGALAAGYVSHIKAKGMANHRREVRRWALGDDA